MAYTVIQQVYNTISNSLKTAKGNVELIKSIKLDSKTLDSSAGTFVVIVEGTAGAFFDLQIQRSSDSRYYNFDTRTFEANYTNKSRSKKLRPGTQNIEVPAASGGDTYTAQFYTSPAYNTEISIGSNKYFHTVQKKQFKDTTITFIASGDTTQVTSTTIDTLTGSIVKQTPSTVKIVDKQISVQAVAADFGFFLNNTTTNLNNGTWNQGAMYWQSGNYVANGGGTDSTSLVLTSVEGLVVGMQVAKINSVYQEELRSITAINTSTKTVTLDGNETWSDTHVIIFRAYGPSLINQAIGVKLSVDSTTARLGQITTSIDDEITSNVAAGADINVNGTLGISKGAKIRMRGLNKSSSSSDCTVSAVDNVANGGGITGGALQLANGQLEASSDRPIRTKTTIYVDGSSNELFLTGNINVTKFPDTNQNIYIDTDKMLTAGTAT